jgi:hypothetical protein
MLQKATTKNTYIYIFFFEEVRQKVVIYNVMTIGFCPSSINQLLIKEENLPLESSKLLPPIRFIRVLNVDKDKPVKDQLKVIREDVLYTLNEVYQVLQVVEHGSTSGYSISKRQ